MSLKLTTEQCEALRCVDGPVPVENEQTRELYFIVDKSTLDELQQQQDLAAIREGLADVAAGRVQPLRESIAEIRKNLGLPQQTQ